MSTKNPRAAGPARSVTAALVVPPLVVAAAILLMGVNVYLQDEWDAIGQMLITRDKEGLSLALLWAPHNEHRMPLPRLLFLILHGRGPHLVLGMLLSLGVMGLSFLLLSRSLLRPVLDETSLSTTPRLRVLLAALFSAMFFSFGQGENLFWNFQLAWALAVLGLLVAALGLHARRPPWFFAGLALCFLCSAHWVALLPVVVADGAYRIWQARTPPAGTPRGSIAPALLMTTASVALLLLLLKIYVRGGPASPIGPFLKHAAAHPLDAARYFLTLLGNIHFWHGAGPTALLAPLCGVLFLGLCGVLLARGALRPTDPAFHLIALTLVLTSIICMGRAQQFGAEQALNSRYQACTMFGWFALLCTAQRVLGDKKWARLLVLGCLINVLLSSVSGLRIHAIHELPKQLRGQECQDELVREGKPLARPECEGLLYPVPARQQDLTVELARLRLL